MESPQGAQRLEGSGVRHVTPTGRDAGHVAAARVTWECLRLAWASEGTAHARGGARARVGGATGCRANVNIVSACGQTLGSGVSEACRGCRTSPFTFWVKTAAAEERASPYTQTRVLSPGHPATREHHAQGSPLGSPRSSGVVQVPRHSDDLGGK